VAATLTVEIDDKAHTLEWPAGRRMLDVMIDAGSTPPTLARRASAVPAPAGSSAATSDAHNEVLEDQDLPTDTSWPASPSR